MGVQVVEPHRCRIRFENDLVVVAAGSASVPRSPAGRTEIWFGIVLLSIHLLPLWRAADVLIGTLELEVPFASIRTTT